MDFSQLGSQVGSFNFSPWNLLGSVLFSSIGFVAFSYGKKMGKFETMAMGAALMVYSYFTPTVLTWLVGFALTGYLWSARG